MTPKISFIIPAFNAAGFIADAIDSVIAQTISDWELIIVDDNSSDATLHIADRYAAADARIRVIRRTEGSGGGFIPRYEAVAAAKSDFILPLDADDVILPDYAAILLGFISNSDASAGTIVYPAEYMWIPPFDKDLAWRPEYFDPQTEITCRPGKDAVRLTLDGWRVPAAGGLIPRALYLEAYRQYGIHHHNFIYADEILTRHLMYLAQEVIFTEKAVYYCRTHAASVTNATSLRRLEILKACRQLLDFTRLRFGTSSEEYRLAHRQLFHWIFLTLDLLSDPHFSAADRKKGYEAIESYRRLVDLPLIRSVVSRKYLSVFHLPLPAIRRIMSLRHKLLGK